MKLLTQELRNKIPQLCTQENNPNPTIVAKYFTPMSCWTWFVIEGEPVVDEGGNEIDFCFFGLVEGFETELGYFHLSEFEDVNRHMPIGIERDLYFAPKPIRELSAYQSQWGNAGPYKGI